MAMSIKTLKDVFIHELSDTLNAEKQLTKALPKMVEAASNPDLKAAFEEHLAETKDQIKKIEKAVELSGIKLKDEKCDAMEGLVKEGDEVIKEIAKGPIRDAALIAAAQKVEHYEIASYGTLVALADLLGFDEASEILAEILEQEAATDEKLTDLAESGINEEANEMEAAA